VSKKALQDFIEPHKEKWLIAVHGKLTQKTNKNTMRAVLLDRALSFTLRAPSMKSNGPDLHVEGQKGNLNKGQCPAVVNMDHIPSDRPHDGMTIDSSKVLPAGEFGLCDPDDGQH
jgi:hypothetical protein